MIQRKELDVEHWNSCFWLTTAIGLFSAGLIFSFSNVIASLFREDELGSVVRWLSLSLVFNALSLVPSAILMRDMNFKPLAVRRVLSTLAGGALGIWMAFNGYGVWSLVGKQLLESFSLMVLVFYLGKKYPSFSISMPHLSSLWGFSSKVFATSVLTFFSNMTDKFIIGLFLGPMVVGVYAVAARLVQLLQNVLTNAVGMVLFSSFSKLQNDPERLKNALLKSIRLLALMIFPLFVFIAVISDLIVKVFLGDKWLDAGVILTILVLGAMASAITALNHNFIYAIGKPQWVFSLILVDTILNISLLLIFTQWGLVPVSVALAIRMWITAIVPVLFLKSELQMQVKEVFAQLIVPSSVALSGCFFILLIRYVIADSIAPVLMLMLSLSLAVIVTVSSLRVIDKKTFYECGGLILALSRGPNH